jgi:thioesterase domain-containing protein
LLAHAVTERLERRGHHPAGLVLLDTYETDPGEFTEDWLAQLATTGLRRLHGQLEPARNARRYWPPGIFPPG